MSKPIIITSLRFKKPGEVKALRGLAKYLQYRDGSIRREAFLGPEHRYPEGVSDYVRSENRGTRWIDRGMGETYKQIANQAYDWQGRRTLARTWVISPDPELMKHVPADKRFEIIRRVTEHTVERWYSDNGWGRADYSYVVHDKHRAADGEQMAHAHVITPGTIPVDEPGELGRIDHYVGRAQLRDLHRTAAEAFKEELGRVLGHERALEIIAERDARLEREHDQSKNRKVRFHNLRRLSDVLALLEMQKESRRSPENRKKPPRAQQVQAELRFYARYINEERQQRLKADRRRIAVARQQEREAELGRERARHRVRIGNIIERGQRIPTHAELRAHEETSRRELQAYFASLLAKRQQELNVEIEFRGREIER